MKYKKICFVSSSGGHLEELMMLKPLMDKYDSFIVTERVPYHMNLQNKKTYYVFQVNRKEKMFLVLMVLNILISIFIFIKERPNVIISSGALATIPMCFMAKIFGKKLIYIESFAKVISASKTGKIMYKLADQFYVQWKSMIEIYPNAINLGGVF